MTARTATAWLGWAALAAFVASALFPGHRLFVAWPARLRPAFRASAWLRAHRVAGTLGFVLAFVHVGFRWPRTATGALLLLLLGGSLAGVGALEALARRVPRLLSERLRVSEPAVLLPARVAELAQEADAIAGSLPGPARAAHAAHVAPLLAAPRRRFQPPRPEEASGPLAAVEAAWPEVDDDGREALDDVRTILVEKLELDTQYGLEGVLALARFAHATVTGALLGLAAVHGASFLAY